MRDNQFLVIGFSLIDNDFYRRVMASSKGIEMTYQWLRRNIVRAPMRNRYAMYVYEHYFTKGVLATSINTDQLAKDLFLSKPTVLKNLELLAEAGLIKIDAAEASRGGNQNPQRIYKFGRWIDENGKYNEYYYTFDIVAKEEIYGNGKVIQ